MTTHIETLTQVMNDIVANRKALNDQVNTQSQQLEIGKAQLEKFDVLIAALQVTISDDAAMEATAETHAANQLIAGDPNAPLVGAAPVANDPVAAVVSAPVASAS